MIILEGLYCAPKSPPHWHRYVKGEIVSGNGATAPRDSLRLKLQCVKLIAMRKLGSLGAGNPSFPKVSPHSGSVAIQ